MIIDDVYAQQREREKLIKSFLPEVKAELKDVFPTNYKEALAALEVELRKQADEYIEIQKYRDRPYPSDEAFLDAFSSYYGNVFIGAWEAA
jgi:hypothetical protein